MAKVAFVTTVKNDPLGLAVLLASLAKQTRKPDEIIVIDAEKTKTNRAQGRNLGIKKAKSNIIAVSDSGCRLDEKWLEKITAPFQEADVDVVVGNYQPVAKNIFQKCLAAYTTRLGELPSSRSIAFQKKAWQKVNGYPEELVYCEDLVFGQRLKKAGLRFIRAPEAIVFWPQRKNLTQAFQQFFNYAHGDGQALYWPHLVKISLVYLRYLLGIWLFFYSLNYWLIGLLVYSFYAIIKNYYRVKNWRALIYLPILQVTADLAVISGAIKGIIKKR